MSITIPTSTAYSIKRDQVGIQVYALQRALGRALGAAVAPDMAFGATTEKLVKEFQQVNFLDDDGIAGPATQRKLGEKCCQLQNAATALPAGVLEGFCEGEGGWMLAAVSWSTPGGVDCGMVQRRVYTEQFGDDQVVKNAFNLPYQLSLMAESLRELKAKFGARSAVTTAERAWRLAILNHNYPYGADLISRVGIDGLPASWRQPAAWVQRIGAVLPDGYKVQTPEEWCRFYALGWPKSEHPWSGLMTRKVTSWPQ